MYRFIVGLILFFGAAQSLEASSLKVAIVDVQKIQAPYKEKIESHLNKVGEELRGEFSVIENELRAEKEILEKEKNQETELSSDADKEALHKRMESFEAKVQVVHAKEEVHRKDLQQKLAVLEMKFSETLAAVLKIVAEEYKIDILLPKGAVLFHSSSMDITESVAKKLQEKKAYIFSFLPEVTRG